MIDYNAGTIGTNYICNDYVIDYNAGTIIDTFSGHKAGVADLAFYGSSEDEKAAGSLLLTASEDCTVKVSYYVITM